MVQFRVGNVCFVGEKTARKSHKNALSRIFQWEFLKVGKTFGGKMGQAVMKPNFLVNELQFHFYKKSFFQNVFFNITYSNIQDHFARNSTKLRMTLFF